jgi:hypothetical protein
MAKIKVANRIVELDGDGLGMKNRDALTSV